MRITQRHTLTDVTCCHTSNNLQIFKMVKARSAEGLSLTSNVSELLLYTVSLAYNMKMGYPINTYGETWPCWIQVQVTGYITAVVISA